MKYALALILALPGIALAQVGSEADSLWNDATVYRDEWGVPHVYANDTRSMAFAFGYVQAEDHLEDMLVAYRVANGRASEIYGERFIALDRYAHLMRHSDLAMAAYDTLDAVTKDLCEGFALGVNSWIVEHPDEVPAWAEGVRPVDVLTFFHHYIMTMMPFDYDGIYHPDRGTPLANAWALAPSRTKKGNSILVMSPHTDYDGIFQWYEAHLVTRDLNMYGATLFGLPVIMMGHNETLGWALAPNEPDIADVIGVEHAPEREPWLAPNVVRSAASSRKQFRKGLYTDATDTRSFYVWTNKGMSLRQTERYMTREGPVVGFRGGVPLAFKAGGYRDFGGLRQLYDMGRAKDVERFQTVWERQQLPLFHAVYTDRSGNLFYSYNAKVGDKSSLRERRDNMPRLQPTMWEAPLLSNTPGAYWGNEIRPRELPWLLNPESGYIQASGTPPWLVTSDTNWTRWDWPDWLVRDADSYRAKRLRQLFQYGQFSFEDTQAILYDAVVPLAVETVPYLQQAARANAQYVYNSHPDLQVALRMLGNWDFLARDESTAMTFFHVWWTLFSRNYEKSATASEALHAMLQQNTPEMQRFLLDSAAQTARLMRDEYQTIQIPWGDVHMIRRGKKEVSISGAYSGEPLFGVGDTYYERGKWIAKHGPGFTMAVEFDDVPRAVSLVPFGTSEDPDSEHFDDQLNLLAERRFKHVRYARTDVEEHSVEAFGKAVTFRPPNSGAAVLVRTLTAANVRLGISDTFDLDLPGTAVAYTPYLEPIAEPARIPMESTIEFHVPESLCSQETLGTLVAYGYSPQSGWSPVPEQQLNRNTRTIYARGYGRQVYAVLGERDGLVGKVALESYESFEPDVRQLVSASPETTESIPADRTVQQPLSETERWRIAANLPTKVEGQRGFDSNQQLSRIGEGSLPFANFKGSPIPSVPPGWQQHLETWSRFVPIGKDSAPPARIAPVPRKQTPKKSERKAAEQAQTETDTAALPSPEGIEVLNSAEEKKELVLTNIETVEAPVTSSIVVEDLPEPMEVPKSEPTTDPPEEKQATIITTDMIKRHREAKAIESKENPFRQVDGVMWREGLPEELNRRTAKREPEKLVLASNPDLASLLKYGKEISFPIPIFNATFDLTMGRMVRAQIEVLPEPPEPYPAGLTAFSATFNVLYKDRKVPGSLAGMIRISSDVCAQEDFEQLALYTYDEENGWVETVGATQSVEHMNFLFLDQSVRAYAVLGPIAVQKARPKILP